MTTTTTTTTTSTTTATIPFDVRLSCQFLGISVFGVTQTRAGQTGGMVIQLLRNSSVWSSRVLGSVRGIVPATASSPNALAYSESEQALYMASLTGSASVLYRMIVATGQTSMAGSLRELAGGATFLNGSYWYVAQHSDRLRRVTLSSGVVVADAVVASMTRGTMVMDYGDIDFWNITTLVVASTLFNKANAVVGRQLALFNVLGSVFEILSPATPSSPLSSILSQIAVYRGVIYNHNTGNGNLQSIDLSGAFSTALVVSEGFTDLASPYCDIVSSTDTTVVPTSPSVSSVTFTSPVNGAQSTSSIQTTAASPVYSTAPIPTSSSPFINPYCSEGAIGVFGVVQSQGDVYVSVRSATGVWSTIFVRSVAGLIPVSTSSPNGLAFDAVNGFIYLASLTGTASRLYRLDVPSGALTIVGPLADLAGGATFFNGSYWYTAQRADRLRRVSFTASGITDVLVANMTRGAFLFDYGDIDFDMTGLLYLSLSVMSAKGATVSRDLATFNPSSGVFRVVSSGVASVSLLGQIAFAGSTLFNHLTAASSLSVVDPASGVVGLAQTATLRYTDIAGFACRSLATPGPSVMPSTAVTPSGPAEFACPKAPVTLFGITMLVKGVQVGGDIVVATHNGSLWRSYVLGNVRSVLSPTTSSPNALAYWPAGQLLLFATLTGTFSQLYSFHISTSIISSHGSLLDLAGGATFFNGSFWYVTQRSDRLRRVSLDGAGRVVSDSVVANMTGGAKLFDYGDIDFLPSGLLIASCKVVNSAGTALSRDVFTYNVTSGAYTVLRSGSATIGDTSLIGQIGVAVNGTVFNHVSSSGSWTTLGLDGSISSPAFSTVAVSDIASFRCD
jgi:hypothetical protein